MQTSRRDFSDDMQRWKRASCSEQQKLSESLSELLHLQTQVDVFITVQTSFLKVQNQSHRALEANKKGEINFQFFKNLSTQAKDPLTVDLIGLQNCCFFMPSPSQCSYESIFHEHFILSDHRLYKKMDNMMTLQK